MHATLQAVKQYDPEEYFFDDINEYMSKRIGGMLLTAFATTRSF
jgi:hypothetical protein